MFDRRWNRNVVAIAVAGCVALGASGCQRWAGMADLRNGRLQPPDKSKSPEAASVSALNQDVWIRTFPAPGSSDKPEYRWQSPAMYQMLSLPPNEQPDLHGALAAKEPIVAANAAIALARQRDPAGQEQLVRAIRDRNLKLPLRRAAVEALAHLSGPAVPGLLEDLEHEYGNFAGPAAAAYVPELHAELLYALARHVQPADTACMTMAARSPAAEVRLAVLECWTQAKGGELPLTVADLRSDPNDRVRAAALTALAASRHPRTLEWSKAAMADYVLDVRLAAIAAAGSVGGAEAQAVLRKQVRDPSEIVRAAAVLALAEVGDAESVHTAAVDKSWRVRKVAAERLGHENPSTAQPLLRELLVDRSAEVQRQAIASLEHWPLAAAAPLLLDCLARSTYLGRKSAAEQLGRRWPPAAEFSADLPHERREEVIARLRTKWRSENGVGELSTAPQPQQPVAPRSDEEWKRAVAAIATLQNENLPEDRRREALGQLRQLGPRLLPVLGTLRLEQEQPVPEAVYRELLPEIDPLFHTLELLASSQVEDRRRASSDLAQAAAAQERLPALAIDRIALLGAKENDPLVCRWLLTAVQGDDTGLARPLVYAGLGHPADEVRRLAYEELSRTARREDCQALLAGLDDGYPPVVRAALRGLSRPGALDDAKRIVVALHSQDKSVQLEAALALVRLGSADGPPALERLAHDQDGDVRRQTAAALGSLHDSQFEPLLVELLDDPVARQAAVESLESVVGRDIAQQPDGPRASLVERIDRWKHWWAEQDRTRR